VVEEDPGIQYERTEVLDLGGLRVGREGKFNLETRLAELQVGEGRTRLPCLF
jgi:hypothetical protein